MKHSIVILAILQLLYCDSDPNSDKRRKTNKYKIAAIVCHNSEAKSVVQVDSETYAKYNISDTYSGGKISLKYIENKFFYFVISKITKDK